MLRVFSIFRSIQGESSKMGLPCTFVRLAGCPLGCSYCDTRDACKADGEEMSVTRLLREVSTYHTSLVEVTGGEPLAQEETTDLLRELSEAGYEVLLETSGAFDISSVDPRVRIVMDIKCPGSGMGDRNRLENLEALDSKQHELKFVVGSKADFDWSIDFIERHGLVGMELLFSPVTGKVSMELLAKWILEGPVCVRLQPQLHKLVWPAAQEEA